jgi:hypothetical protein
MVLQREAGLPSVAGQLLLRKQQAASSGGGGGGCGGQGPRARAAGGRAGSSSPAAAAAAVAAAAYLLLWSQGVLLGGLNKKRASKLNAPAAGLVPAVVPKQSEGTYVSRVGVPATWSPRVPRVWLAFSHTLKQS